MSPLRQWAGIRACLGLFGLSAFHPVQADPVGAADTAPAQSDQQAHDEKSDKHAQIVPILIGGCALFTLALDHGGFNSSFVTTGLPDTPTNAAGVSTTPGGLSGTSQPVSAAPNSGLTAASPNSVTLVPEASSWAAFAFTGLGALGMALRARRRIVRSV